MMATTPAREFLERVWFVTAPPSPLTDAEDMLTIAWREDGLIVLASATDNPVRLAARLRELVAVLSEYPDITEEAAGVSGAAFRLTGTPLRRFDAPGAMAP
jgi:hypothetical protein